LKEKWTRLKEAIQSEQREEKREELKIAGS
jgi:hypothetical protein